MKAIIYTKYGSPDVLKLQEVEKPLPKENEVLVKVHAASINSWDWDLLMGKPFIIRLGRPMYKILGADVAGRVEVVGKSVKQFQPGDEVFGDLSEDGWGGFAEYVCASENALALKPARLSFEQAGAVPQAAVMAMQSIHKYGPIEPGQKVLINGAGGGVGSFAVQLAKSMGAEVTGVDSTSKLDMMGDLGADHVIDYTRENFTKNGNQYDLIIDAVARRSVFDIKRSLNHEGRYIVVGGSMTRILQVMLLKSWLLKKWNKKMDILRHQPNKDLDSLSELFEAGKVKPFIDKVYPLSKTPDAFRYFGEGQFQGKVVITIK